MIAAGTTWRMYQKSGFALLSPSRRRVGRVRTGEPPKGHFLFHQRAPPGPVRVRVVEAIGVHLVAGVPAIPALRNKTLVAGLVDGRNVWRADLNAHQPAPASATSDESQLTLFHG